MEGINFEADVAKAEHKTGDQSSLNSDWKCVFAMSLVLGNVGLSN